MTTRQDIPIDERNPVDHLDSGYEGNNIPDDYYLPSCGLEDVDKAVHKLFDKELGFQTRTVGTTDGQIDLKKPFVLLATGERFALVKKLKPIRDKKTGALILPAIAIRRTGTEQTSEDIMGRGMNQSTGTITVKRRLDKSDKDYQGLINKLAFKNANLPETRRETGSYGNSPGVREGSLLAPNLGNNIWEMITIPQPQFWTQTYEITFWTNYTQHMNYMLETLYSSFLPQGKMFKLTTDKGYWFIGYVDDQFVSGDNFDDFTENDRLIRYTFTMKVKSFLLAANGPGNKVPIRRHISAPTISFELVETYGQVSNENQIPNKVKESQFTLTDIEDLESPQDKTTNQKVVINKEVINPITGQKEIKTVRVLEANQKTGETVYYASQVTSLDEFVMLLK